MQFQLFLSENLKGLSEDAERELQIIDSRRVLLRKDFPFIPNVITKINYYSYALRFLQLIAIEK